MSGRIERSPGEGWLALIGGGEFSFGETELSDRAWLARTPAGPIGFVPTASGSADYGHNFCSYLDQVFEREAEIVPIYRPRDAKRPRNLARLESASAVYLGGGLVDDLLETLAGSPAVDTLAGRLRDGGVVVAIAAAAQATGEVVRGLRGQKVLSGFGWLPGGVVETNFDPGHDRRLRDLLRREEVGWGLGIPGGSSVLLGPAGEIETVGTVFVLADAEADFELLGLNESTTHSSGD